MRDFSYSDLNSDLLWGCAFMPCACIWHYMVLRITVDTFSQPEISRFLFIFCPQIWKSMYFPVYRTVLKHNFSWASPS